MKPFDVSLGSKDEESIESQIERLESGKVYGLRERERRTMLRQLYSGNCRCSELCDDWA